MGGDGSPRAEGEPGVARGGGGGARGGSRGGSRGGGCSGARVVERRGGPAINVLTVARWHSRPFFTQSLHASAKYVDKAARASREASAAAQRTTSKTNATNVLNTPGPSDRFDQSFGRMANMTGGVTAGATLRQETVRGREETVRS